MTNESYLIRQERCPLCAAEGRDRTGNNLSIYSDGHSFCFGGHGLVDVGNPFKKIKEEVVEQHSVVLPVDCDVLYPQRCIDWISKYDLTKNDLYNHNVMWSESIQRLIFPIYDNDFVLIAWQGRYFGNEEKVKWFGRGDLKNTFNFIGKGGKLVLVEDVISAIKIGKAGFTSLPLYGCVVGRERFKRILSLYGYGFDVVVWLDENKRPEGVKEARLGTLYGLNCTTVFSIRDPKDESYESIKNYLIG